MNRTDTITTRWATLSHASRYCGLSERLLQSAIQHNLIRSSLVRKPNARRGRRLVDLRSLDEWIELGIGGKSDLPALASSHIKSNLNHLA
jgi:hypothetical protein